jgi:hypothetical protein
LYYIRTIPDSALKTPTAHAESKRLDRTDGDDVNAPPPVPTPHSRLKAYCSLKC